jgi:hypothetical protein
MMKAKPDFNIYNINDNADDESDSCFIYLKHRKLVTKYTWFMHKYVLFLHDSLETE